MVNHRLPELAAELKRVKKPVLAGHVMPDGDSIGSTIALGLMLEQFGVGVTLVSQDPIPANYRFLPGVERIHIGAVPDEPFDGLILLDCSVPERAGEAVQSLFSKPGIRVIHIDHHISAVPFADFNYVDPAAAAVGEIVFDLTAILGAELTRDIAANLYTAINTDTGSFRYENTTPETHRRVARLMETGVQVGAVNTEIYDEKPVEAVRLLQRVLGTLALSTCGRIAWLTLTLAMEAECGATDVNHEGIINYARLIRGVEVGILFRELPDGRFKVSFRSKRLVNVNLLAAAFGGGGHPRAAGCTMFGRLEDVEPVVIATAGEMVAEAFNGRRS